MQTRNIIVLAILVILIGGIVWWGVGMKKEDAPKNESMANTNAAIEADLNQDLGNLDADFQEIDAEINGL